MSYFDMSESSVFSYFFRFPTPIKKVEMPMQLKVAGCPLGVNSLLHFSKSTPKCYGRRNIPTELIPARAFLHQGRVKTRDFLKYIFLLLAECSYLLTMANALSPCIHLQPIHLLYFSTKRGHKSSFLPCEGTGGVTCCEVLVCDTG